MYGTKLLRVAFVFYSLNTFTVETTRFLPMIVWDHLNPLLSCKCNWFTFSKIDLFDQIDLMCPSLKVAVHLIDGYSRTKDQMNENIFRRKWKGTNLDDLKRSLNDGSFCDPQHSDTVKLFSCIDGEEGKSLVVKFKKNSDALQTYEEGDIIVFFNNGHDGQSKTLKNNSKQCSGVFIANITKGANVHHDFSYGKCLNSEAKTCRDINKKCSTTCGVSTESHFMALANSTTHEETSSSSPDVSSFTAAQNPTQKTTKVITLIPERHHRNTSCNEFNIKYFGIGLLAGVGLFCLIFVIFFIVARLKVHKAMRTEFSLTSQKVVLNEDNRSKDPMHV